MEQADLFVDQDLKLFIVLTRAFRAISDRAMEDMKGHGLHPTEFMVLEVLYHRGNLPIQQIRQKVLLASGSITYVIDKLERKELVKRIPCPNDARVIHASITQKGNLLMEEIFPQHQQVIKKIFSSLDEQEKQVMRMLLKKVGYEAQNLK